jgi:hypothetical protein
MAGGLGFAGGVVSAASHPGAGVTNWQQSAAQGLRDKSNEHENGGQNPCHPLVSLAHGWCDLST